MSFDTKKLKMKRRIARYVDKIARSKKILGLWWNDKSNFRWNERRTVFCKEVSPDVF